MALFCAVLNTRADSWEPDNDGASATPIVVTEIRQSHGPHTLDVVDTNDWFKMELTAGIPYDLKSSGALDTKAFLYSDEAGTLQVADDDQGGENSNFRIIYQPIITGTYYLKVQEHVSGPQHGGEYTLEHGYYAADEWDRSDDAGTNGTLISMSPAASFHGPHVVDQYDLYDWFRITLNSGIVYRFETHGEGDTDTYGSLYAHPGDVWPLAENDDDPDGELNLNFRFDFMPDLTTEYYVKVEEVFGGLAQYDLWYYIPANDSEPDQLLDAWEIQYFGDLSATPFAHDDTDMQNNLNEYIAGTDPTDSNSYFAVTTWHTGSFVLGWPSAQGREYRVFWTGDMATPFEQIGPVIDHPQNSYTDTLHSAESSGFYKMEVQVK